ncbi:PACE efflux transporter [Facilibium subflavum]|uniref:PACE efflux transporter n=1 Tax=Facilibium subflavum TaxID=2219058 RepID=UPI000E65666A|nr:PACE efflux transporter [Facilibium subflavum]
MSQHFNGLSLRQRIMHIVFFEAIALLILTPVVAWVMHQQLDYMFSMTITTSLIASLWNFLFNYIFDQVEKKFDQDRIKRSITCRVIHTTLFQVSLMMLIIPTIAVFLGLSLTQAFLLDISFLCFFMAYTAIYNYVFDLILFKALKIHLKAP